MSDYLSILPLPSTSFSGSIEPAVIETKMDSGRIRSRRRFTRELRNYNATWEMDDFQFGMFQAWVFYELKSGSEFFNISLPLGGEGFKTVSARIKGGKYSWQYKPVSNWTVTATLQVETGAVMPFDDYTALLLAGDVSALEAAVAHFEAYLLT